MRGLTLFALAGAATAYPRVDGPGAAAQAAGVQFSSRAAAAAGKTVIPKDSFGTAFDTHWSHNYPWGTDHNGGARMNPLQDLHGQQRPDPDRLARLRRAPRHQRRPAVPRALPVGHRLREAAAHRQAGGGYDLEAEFKAPVAKGTWPAFWLTAVKGWPPEIDVAEWKGSGKISFNTFNTSSQVAAHDVTYPSPENWHKIRAQIRTASATDVWVKFFMDDGEITTQYGKNYVNSAFYLVSRLDSPASSAASSSTNSSSQIIDLQMEGSSGSPGPSAGTTFQIRNVQVTDYNP
ncbi:glycoside hydrolase family 16 protein [Apiospora rasikravindrae]|uniref:Glycoside hydrolase family 16 protein n=1 Tax=Apiospora rasikravindrae TaxID=990691 RepID=A0ABR1U9Y6_9PEZI